MGRQKFGEGFAEGIGGGFGGGSHARLFRYAGALTGVAVLGLAGCGSVTPQGGSVTVTAPSSATSADGAATGTVKLDEHANNTTVKVGVGATVEIDLHSTYWSAVDSSAPQLVERTGSPVTSTAPAGPTCRVGSGCGTVTTTFLAHLAGSAQLTSARSTCGEAMACSPDQRAFTVTIQVVNAG